MGAADEEPVRVSLRHHPDVVLALDLQFSAGLQMGRISLIRQDRKIAYFEYLQKRLFFNVKIT